MIPSRKGNLIARLGDAKAKKLIFSGEKEKKEESSRPRWSEEGGFDERTAGDLIEIADENWFNRNAERYAEK